MRIRYIEMIAAGAFALATPLAFAGPATVHDAIAASDTATLATLLSSGADLDALNGAGEPPLIAAVLLGHTEMARAMIEAGADSRARTSRGLTALHAAAFSGHSDLAALLLEVDVDVNDNNNRFKITPLHAAAEEGHPEIVKLLLDASADVEIGEVNGYSPLTRAGWRERWEIARLLIAAGAICQPEELVGDWLYKHCTELTN